MPRIIVHTKIDPVQKDITLAFNELLSPAAKSRAFADIARQLIKEADETNRRALGRIPEKKIYVDGQLDGAHLESVRNTIAVQYELLDETLAWIGDQLELHSPVLTGRYKRSHSLFADGMEIPVGQIIPAAREYVFINAQPYARKIERGLSSQAPDGVYQAVALLARRKFGKIARINYTFRTAIGGKFVYGRAGDRSSQRNPAISVRPR